MAKNNHSDYADVQISQENLKLYSEEGPPVIVDFRSSVVNKHKEATSIFDIENEDGVHEGECPFVVHGITGEKLFNIKQGCYLCNCTATSYKRSKYSFCWTWHQTGVYV